MKRKAVSLLFFLGLFFAATVAHAKVYDCFMFFNEIELLKMRLEELDGVVDHFVLVESIETQRGDPKPLYFQENKHLYEHYLPKIIHIIVDEHHPEMELWERENYQRECILRGLTQCHDDDLIIISDLDEIPRTSVITELKETMPQRNAHILEKNKDRRAKKHNKKKKGPSHTNKLLHINGARALVMAMYFYQLNREEPGNQCPEGSFWAGSIVTTYGMVKYFGPQHFRDYRWRFQRIYRAGWHFTWMGGKEKIRQKLCSVVEGQPLGYWVPDETVEAMINHFKPVPIDETFPAYIHRHFDELWAKGFIAPW